MPPLPVVPQVIKFQIKGTYHDTAWVNIFYVQYSGAAPSSSDLFNWLTAQQVTTEDFYTAEMSADNELTEYIATDLTSSTGATSSIARSAFGVRSGDFNPANVAACMSLHINRRYRGGHPRKYFSIGTSGTFATGSTKDWDSGFITDCESKFEAMLAGMIGITEGGTTFAVNVNVSYRNAGAVRPTAVVDPIVGIAMATRVCSQRRRLGKVGG